MGEHGHWQKTPLFENATHVPLIMAGPGVMANGKTTVTIAEMVDIYPTLAELSGMEAPDYLSGVSLVPALRDVAARPRESALTQFGTGYTVRTARFRFTEWGQDGADGLELYDHDADPQEMTNLAMRMEYEETRNELRKLWHNRVAASVKKPDGVVQIRFDNRRWER